MNIFLARIANNDFYKLEQAIRSFPYADIKIRQSFYRGPGFPLTYALPCRIDRSHQGYWGLQAYDVLVLAGVDPIVFTPKEMSDIVAYVENGGGLLVVGGQYACGNALGSYDLWERLLPVDFTKAPDVEVNARPTIVKEHPVTAGLPDEWGEVGKVHQVELRSGGEVLMEVTGHPLLVAGAKKKGRVLVLNTFPECEFVDGDYFFTGDYYDDLVRQSVEWLMGKEKAITPTRFLAPAKEITVNGKVNLVLGLSSRRAVKGKVVLSAERGGERQQLAESKLALEGEKEVKEVFRPGGGYEDDGCYGLCLQVFDDKGELEVQRDCRVKVINPTGVWVEIKSRKETTAPGFEIEFIARAESKGRKAPDLELEASILDFRGKRVHSFRKKAVPKIKSGYEPVELAWQVPNVAKGKYSLRVSLKDEAGQTLDEENTPFFVVDPLDREDAYPIISTAVYGTFDEEGAAREIEDIREHGFNTLSVGTLKHYPWDGREKNSDRLTAFAERYAQVKGMMIHSHDFGPPSFSREAPPSPCLFSAEFPSVLEQHLAPSIANGRKIPRLVNVETVDEPLASAGNVCHCEHCEKAFKERFGCKMPTWEETEGKPALRTKFLQFVSDYWKDIFDRIYEIKQKAGVSFDINHTFCQLSFGAFTTEQWFRDTFAWAPSCDSFDFDIYPYMYRMWRASLEMGICQVRYQMSGHRYVAQHFGKPLALWVEISDRNHPQYVIPERASGEITYTMIGQGGDYINTFINVPFSIGLTNGARQERWEAYGEDLRKIRSYAPVLTRCKKPKAKVAMLFPFTNWKLEHKHKKTDRPPGYSLEDGWPKWDYLPQNQWYPFDYLPYNGFELIFRSFGELDVIPEQLVESGELKNHRALALLGATYITQAAAEKIVKFVEAGGLLICDKPPAFNENGERIKVFDSLFGGEPETISGDLTVRRSQFGRGKTLLFSRDVDDAFSTSVEQKDPVLRFRLKETIRNFLFGEGLRPFALPSDDDFEVDFLAGQDCFLLVVVNHGEVDSGTPVVVFNPPFEPEYAVDLGTGEEIPFDFGGDDGAEESIVDFDIFLGSRCGRIIAFHPTKPERNKVTVQTARVKKGEELKYTVSLLDEEGRPVRGHQVVEISVIDPEGTVRERYGGSHSTTDGVYAKAIPLAVNEASGKWRIEVYDRYSRKKSEAGFEVT